MMTRIHIVTLCLSFLWTALIAESQIDLRIVPAVSDDGRYVIASIELRPSTDKEINIAGQNYRLFYNTSSLRYEEEKAHVILPQNKYGDINITQLKEGIGAHVGQLNFDKDLGFINFNIELKDHENGGIVLRKSEGWKPVASIAFKIIDNKSEADLVWSREDRTDSYVTAFVEMSEWIDARHTQELTVNEFSDASLNLDNSTEIVSVELGPNPTTNILNVFMSKATSEDVEIAISNAIGQVVWKGNMGAENVSKSIDVSQFPAASYTVQMRNANTNQLIHSQRVIKIN